MHELIADYGARVLLWVLSGLGLLLARYVWTRIANDYLRGVLSRAWDEVTAAVLEVGQVYVDELKAGKADGKLTAAEKATAKQKAIDIAKANIGAKGLRALARIFDVDEWLANKIEAAVGAKSKPPELADPS